MLAVISSLFPFLMKFRFLHLRGHAAAPTNDGRAGVPRSARSHTQNRPRDHFEEQRETNVEYLRTLPRTAGERRARHKSAGEITLQQMLHEWAMHDLGHIRQIAELVRARKHWKQAGPLGEEYKLKP